MSVVIRGVVVAVVVVIGLLGKPLVARAGLTPIVQSDFGPDAKVVTFEVGETGLPVAPGVTFLRTGPVSEPWYGSSETSTGFFGRQGWSNTVSSTYGDLGAQFSPAVQAVGGYVGRIPNFTNQHPPHVTVELFNSSLESLGTASIARPPAFNSPVFFGFRADEPIARFRMTGHDAGFFGVDNFTFASVPEPGALTLLVAGIAALRVRCGGRC